MSGNPHQERLSLPPDPLIQDEYTSPRLIAELPYFSHHVACHRAHVVALVAGGIIDASMGRSLLDALADLDRNGPGAIELRPELNDLSTCTEAYLAAQVGEEAAGRLHSGRSRNDLYMTIQRRIARDATLRIIAAVTELRDVLLVRAQEHSATIFPGYTHHSQQAQPVTFGHFLLAHHDALARDADRLMGSYVRANQSPLGAAALGGSTFGIDRRLLASLLGFGGIIENTQDAAGGRDYQLELASDVAIVVSNLSRLSESLILYTSAEFGLVELNDAFASVSSIMPQKKNPVALEMVEGIASQVHGNLVSMLSTLKSSTLGMSRETGFCDGQLRVATRDTEFALRLMSRIVGSLQVDRQKAAGGLLSSLSTTTDLAEGLVQAYGVPFRLAHRVVGRAVTRSLAEHVPIDGALLAQASLDISGRALQVDEAFLVQALDPAAALEARRTEGGPRPAEVRRMVRARRRSLRSAHAWVAARRAELEQAAARLDDAVAATGGGSTSQA